MRSKVTLAFVEVGDEVVIGGDVTLVAHSVEAGRLVTSRVKIGNRVTLGLMSVIMPGCQVGDNAIVAANAVLKKGTIIPPNTVWAGIPAVQVGERKPRQ